MRRKQTRQTLKLRLLAFVLALALIWYSLNPVPKSITRFKREDEIPDEKKREAAPQLSGAAVLPIMLSRSRTGSSDEPLPNQDEEDDFDWPEFIDG